MSNGTETGLKSNEEIIEELTKDLESSCLQADENCTSTEPTSAKSDASNGDAPTEVGAHVEETNVKNEDSCKSQAQPSESADSPIDFVDEELLKDREIGLTEDEKESLKNEAEKLKNEGNELFKNEEYLEAILTYTKALQACPLAYSNDRAVLYANRGAAKAKYMDKKSAIADCTKALELNPTYEKAMIRRGQLYKETDKLDDALREYKQLNSLHPENAEWENEVRQLTQLVEERNAKLKAEMLGKLKDFGNMVLKPFGLSTNNFELQKDPNSDSYSVKFNRNAS
ncbi:tetratricopeptide repeat domain 1 [Megalopta genalis]|uniref:tetratricopeptide repeat domain 1 n=1 Tax=Megalopta genalis TaxID=115081 RepID=UPI003FD4313B